VAIIFLPAVRDAITLYIPSYFEDVSYTEMVFKDLKFPPREQVTYRGEEGGLAGSNPPPQEKNSEGPPKSCQTPTRKVYIYIYIVLYMFLYPIVF